jgi:hypothetical protein
VGVVFDTNIWIAYQPTTRPESLLMSVVVLQELTAPPEMLDEVAGPMGKRLTLATGRKRASRGSSASIGA